MIQRVVWANLRHRRMRTFLTVAAIGLEVAMILLILGLADGLIGESNRRQRGVGADIIFRPETSDSALSAGSARIAQSMIDELEAIPGIAMAVGTAFSLQGQFQTVTGVDFAKFDRMAGGIRFHAGGPFEQPFDMIVDEVHARQKKLSVGDTVRLLNRDFRLTGIIEAGKMSRIFVPRKTMQEVMNWEGKLSQIFLKLDESVSPEAFVTTLRRKYPKNPSYTMEEFISLFNRQVHNYGDDFIHVIVGIAVVVGFIVVLISMYTAVLDRTREIGILKSLGASPGYVIQIFLRETVLLTIAGIVVGIGLAYTGQSVLEHRFPLITLSILQSHLAWTAVIALLGSTLGSAYPSLRAARQDPIEALAYE